MDLCQGKTFNQAKPAEVMDFLRSRRLEMTAVPPEQLHVRNDGRQLFLEKVNGSVRQFPVRASFVYKLLRWHAFPLRQLRTLNIDTVTGILNDYLLSVRSGDVTLVVEDGEALSVLSGRYNRMEDLAILHRCKHLGIEKISRSDFFTRFYGGLTVKREIVPGDEAGFGVNILNSETGFRALSVCHYILRYICTNGAVIREGGASSKVHYGWREGVLEGWLESAVRACEVAREGVIRRILRTRETGWPGLSDAEVRRVRGILGPARARPFLQELDLGILSVYDGFNRITEEAKSLPMERRFELESLAGDLIPRVSGYEPALS